MKKILAFLAAFSMLGTLFVSASPLYTEAEEKIVTGGVTLKTEKRFYGDYALTVNCITADLKNRNLSLELLKHQGGSDKADTVMNLASGEKGTVAAINGDFFSAYKGDQNFSLGLEVRDGELLQSHINSDMAAGFFDGEGLFFSYVDFSAEVETPDGTKMAVSHINKPTDYYGAVLMYTPAFNGAVSPFLPEGITAMIVTDDTVTAIGVSMGGTLPIPENGYIMVIDDRMTPFLQYKFKEGDKVKVTVSVSPSLDNIKTAFGGGTLLLRDGQKTEITHAVNGNNPRSVIGTNDDGTVVYFLTVDGRQTESRGVSLSSLADICLQAGMVNAINLDGGGSTAMVGKLAGEEKLSHINSPTENRKVINGVAIKSSAASGKATGAFVKAENSFVLSGDSVKLSVTPYDKNYNSPSSVGQYKWVVTEGKGYVKDNVFYAEGSGDAVIELYLNGKKTDSCTVNVMQQISGITAPASLKLSKGESTSLSGKVKVFDAAGNTAVINDISLLNPVTDNGQIAVSSDGKITLLSDGAGQIKLSHSGTQRSIGVTDGKVLVDNDKPVVSDAMQKSMDGGFEIAFYGASKIDSLFDRIVYARTMDILEKKGASVIVGGEIPEDLTPHSLFSASAKAWSEKDYKDFRVITLALSSGKLSRGDQWRKLSASIEGASVGNIFVVTDREPIFTGNIDKEAFHAILKNAAKTKNVFVIYRGTENFCRIANGVRYMTVAGAENEISMSSAIKNTSYLSFNVTDSDISYQYKKLYN